MITVNVPSPKNDNIHTFTDVQLRDRDIFIRFETMKALGMNSVEVINILANTYHVGINTVEKAVYMKNK